MQCKGIRLLLSCINHLHDLFVADVPVSIGLIVAVSVVVPIGPIGLPILVGVAVRVAVVLVTSQELGGKCLDQQYQEEPWVSEKCYRMFKLYRYFFNWPIKMIKQYKCFCFFNRPIKMISSGNGYSDSSGSPPSSAARSKVSFIWMRIVLTTFCQRASFIWIEGGFSWWFCH